VSDVLIIVDANVLIDYVRSDRTVLALAAKHFRGIHVLTTVLAEVDDLDEVDCKALGIRIIEPDVAQLLEAGAQQGREGLSFQDWLCLDVARDGQSMCLTNDGPLRRACAREGVGVWWGLELMMELVLSGQLTSAAARDTAEAIHRSNPRYITVEILKRFESRLTEHGAARRRPRK
jgi:rRNA-processing protein FCF1